ncbi:SDR family NAD(P)-dependent oxidoreductase [Chryseobacterium nematophagum]|uniref:SDR family NAD(P)-dependent oxidoreductase n=1 Tax=Chryseobacterium nematophagum TaxID=2305228 RepID=A0A3M7L836_9FLAO|nr:type I polyketide synthase [Chryseobacterium nematophagum]RMZ58777.1 SDR family NAD(P)-dependent oxidoreductase [Chryseobacterium nematophagum]
MDNSKKNKFSGLEIAVVGISCRVPGAENYNEFWENLKYGKESLDYFSVEDIIKSGVKSELANSESYVKAKRVLKNKENFDYSFFKYTQEESILLSPHSRILHESMQEVMDDSGQNIDEMKDTGLYIGVGEDILWNLHLATFKDQINLEHFSYHYLTGHHYLPSLLSYKFGFTGPTLPIATACSSSLVAINMACRSLLLKDCKYAIAGGIHINTSKHIGYPYIDGSVESIDGKCRAFDKDCSGTSWGEGVGLVMLKKLEEAIKDNDKIYCVIKGGFSNNDSNRKSTYTAPDVNGQKECIEKALKFSRVSPESISYIEAHGTATPLGDAIELEALNKVFKSSCQINSIGIGSVKSNIGHLNYAAGVISFIKACLILKNNEVLPSINFEEVNPTINIHNTPFYINKELSQLKNLNENFNTRIGVSSLGFSGTNCHVILEQFPEKREENESLLSSIELITISANSEYSLIENVKSLKDFLKITKESLKNIAYTYRNSRSNHKYKKSFFAESIEELSGQLEDFMISPKYTEKIYNKSNHTIFLFSGFGSQYIDMGRSLYEVSSCFKKYMDIALEFLSNYSQQDYKSIFISKDETRINEFIVSQPLIFAFQYSYSKFLENIGISADYTIGHSLGEYVCACLSNVFSFEDGLKLVYERAILFNNVSQGRMLSIFINEDEINELLKDHHHIYIASYNSVNNIVVSGKTVDIDFLEKKIIEKEIQYVDLNTGKCFHSAYVEAIKEDYKKILNSVKFNESSKPYISTLKGDFIKKEDVLSVDYWVDHMIKPVQLKKGLEKLMSLSKKNLVLDIGPSNMMTKVVTANYKDALIYSLSDKKKDERKMFFESLGKIWEIGKPILWNNLFEKAKKVSAPSYSFDRQIFVSELDPDKLSLNKKNKNYNLYKEAWESLNIEKDNKNFPNNVIIFYDDNAAADKITEKIHYHNYKKVKLDITCDYEEFEGEFKLNPDKSDHYENLFSSLNKSDFVPDKIIYIWNNKVSQYEDGLKMGYYSFYNLIISHNKIFSDRQIQIALIGSGFYKKLDSDKIEPFKATSITSLKMIGIEFINVNYYIVDFDELKSQNIEKVFTANKQNILYKEISIRNESFYCKKEELITSKKNRNYSFENKTILITGGYGGLGFEVSKYLIKKYRIELIIIGTSEENYGKKQLLEENGSRVYYIQSTFEDKELLNQDLISAQEKLGKIKGIIHTAGVGDYNGALLRRNINNDVKVLTPKIWGTIYLHEILADNELDFFVGFSSRVVSNPFIGQYAYVAANNFMDTYLQNVKNGLSVRWPSISGEGMAKKAIEKLTEFEKKMYLSNNAITAKDMIKILFKSINGNEQLTIASNSSATPLVNISKADSSINKIFYYKRESLDLDIPYVEPQTELEIKICAIIQEALCIDQIGINDNFFEIGGDSLKAMIISGKIKQEFDINYTLRSIFETNTISEIVSDIHNLKNAITTIII